jgi:hypothetical protein
LREKILRRQEKNEERIGDTVEFFDAAPRNFRRNPKGRGYFSGGVRSLSLVDVESTSLRAPAPPKKSSASRPCAECQQALVA